MKSIRLDSQTGYLRIRNFFPFWITSGITFTTYHQSSACASPRNQVDYDRKACQWLTPPILADKGKQTVLDFVPLAGPGRKMTYGNRQTDFIGQFLQLPFPQTSPYAITAAGVRSNQQIACVRIHSSPHCPERTLKHPKTFAGPAQRRLRIASGSGFHQRIHVRQQTRFVLNQSLSTTAKPSASRIVPASATFSEFSESSPNGRKCTGRNFPDTS
jgi:hypothetical protein